MDRGTLPLGDTALALELARLGSESWLCRFLDVCSKTRGFASPILSFFNFQIGTILPATEQGCCEDEMGQPTQRQWLTRDAQLICVLFWEGANRSSSFLYIECLVQGRHLLIC